MDSSYCLSVEIGVICGKFRRMPGAADQTQKLFADRKFDCYILYIFCLLFIYVQVCMLAASNFARTES